MLNKLVHYFIVCLTTATHLSFMAMCMAARYQPVVVFFALTIVLCCGALKKFNYYAQ